MELFSRAVKAHRISLPGSDIGKGTGNASGIVELAQPSFWPLIHGATGIYDKAEPKIGISFKFLYVMTITSAPSAPVKPAEVVARHILPVLCKFKAGSTNGASMAS
jgi:hypothetical protein